MIKLVVWLIFLAFSSYALFCFFLYLQQRRILYYPVQAATSPGMPVITLENENEKLRINAAQKGYKTALIYFGGNAESVALNFSQFNHLFHRADLYFMNYRGYGGSSGSPTEQGLFSDGLALYDEIISRYDSVIVAGRSLGSGVALYLASKRDVAGIVLMTPYDSMVSLASHHYPFMPVKLLLKDRYESVSYIPLVNAPILFVIAENDEIIPRKKSENLIGAVSHDRIRVTVIQGAHHNNFEAYPQFESAIRSFLDYLDEEQLR
ncbi:MAG: alpha/beta hydrolase [Desulfobulbaceae bacterium]|nr:MAG: alpha/beta hydrolase [Desulfobulbaceae bacterium]